MNSISNFKDIHKGKRCFILGNGPALLTVDYEKLQNEITIGSNRIYKSKKIIPTYYCIEDEYMMIQITNEIKNGLKDETIKFISGIGKELFKDMPNANFVNFKYENYEIHPKFSKEFDNVAYLGYTVTYMMLQLAYFLGCNPVYLLGMNGYKKGMRVHFYRENDHVHKIDASREKAMNALKYANYIFKTNNRNLYNLTRNSTYTFFDYKNIEDVL